MVQRVYQLEHAHNLVVVQESFPLVHWQRRFLVQFEPVHNFEVAGQNYFLIAPWQPSLTGHVGFYLTFSFSFLESFFSL